MSNAFNRFQSLVGVTSTEVVTITAINGDGTSNADTLGGNAVTVKGDSVLVGQRAFIRNSEIVRKAPTHSIVTVSI